jgi:hypothetical protein
MTEDRFRAVFKLQYDGDGYIELTTKACCHAMAWHRHGGLVQWVTALAWPKMAESATDVRGCRRKRTPSSRARGGRRGRGSGCGRSRSLLRRSR